MVRTVEQIEQQLVQARRERDAWRTNRNARDKYAFASILVESLEKELSEALNDQVNHDHKTPDSA
ncbi:hypothetical protein [Kluyvera ascorbata]|uniref:hypothetical protein n=1 Tax=Kluyvera ascorbata TaxID=51288 RepID=UPI0034D679BF